MVEHVIVEVIDVSSPSQLPGAISRVSIDSPVEGEKSDVFALSIGGQIDSAAPVTAIEILHGQEVVRRVEILNGRQLILSGAPQPEDEGVVAAKSCSFNVLVGVVGLPREFELSVRAVVGGDTQAQISTVRARHEAPSLAFEPALQPILLSGAPRSGTTWFMRILDSHPGIVVARQLNLESGAARYWTHMLRVLSAPADLAKSSRPKIFHRDLSYVGKNPFFGGEVFAEPSLRRWFGQAYVERLASFCVSNIDDWYGAQAEHQGKDAPRYFAEKDMLPSYLPVLMRQIYNEGKEVFLIRDFRDILCSVMELWRSRDPNKSAAWVNQWAYRLREAWRARGEGAYLLHYEDLVLRPEEALTSLFDYLKLDSSDELVGQILEASPSLRGSVGRWKSYGDDSFRSLCESSLGPVCREFGYVD